MMFAATEQPAPPDQFWTVALFAGAFLAAAAWYAAYRFLTVRSRSVPRQAVLAVARVIVGALALFVVIQAVQRVLVLASNAPSWTFCVGGAAAVELALRIYAAERSRIPRRAARLLGALRVMIALLVIAMLAQPVFVHESHRGLRRTVAVLLDNSASMHVPDTQLSPSEKIRLAESFGETRVGRPCRLEEEAARLDAVRGNLTVQSEWLKMLGGLEPDALKQHMTNRLAELRAAAEEAKETVDGEIQLVTDVLESETAIPEDERAALTELHSRLSEQVGRPLAEAVEQTQESEDDDVLSRHGGIVQAVSAAEDGLVGLVHEFYEMGRRIDDAFYASLSDDDRVAMDSWAHTSRFELARSALTHRPGNPGAAEPGQSLLDRLAEQYTLKVYAFAAEPSELDPAEWSRPDADEAVGEESTPSVAEILAQLSAPKRKLTDMAAALERVIRGIPAEELAGIVLLSDGRHNAPEPVEPLARQLSLARAPVCAIPLGGQRPPKDVAIVSLDVPEVVHVEDTMFVAAELKLDGLAGETVQIGLFDAESSELLNARSVRVPTDQFRRQVELAYTPLEPGLRSYRVTASSVEGEVFADNNEYPLTVNVTEERTKLLIVEGRPRWEFRYLKNLFASRDPSVRTQYVLLEPDHIADADELPRIPASVTRPREQAQATALPTDDFEWMKFDVIILGDVSPEYLTPADLEALQHFVADRSGTLIVIAGPHSMPRAYAGTVLEEMLPARFEAATGPVLEAPEESFRIALTPEGLQSVIMRQEVDPEENAEVWRSMQEMYWRHPILETKPGASVLAYALPSSDPDAPEMDAEAVEQLQRTNALVAVHRVDLGRVMLLNFDRTWRLRYRAGDTHHHKFWGQIIRWATANKLPAGTSLVKLGTDKSRYAPGDSVHVRAKILHTDLSPLANADAAANIYQGDKRVLRRRLEYLLASPGIYAVDLGRLPPGAYRLELECPQAEPILASEGVQKVSVEFAVDPASSEEEVELATDRGLLGRLAGLTGGVMVEAPDAERVLDFLGPSVVLRGERYEYVLWNSWPYLLLIMLLATSEWLLRKKHSLP